MLGEHVNYVGIVKLAPMCTTSFWMDKPTDRVVLLLKYLLRLKPGGRRAKYQIVRDGLEMFIVDYSSVKCAYSA